jgi:uncharacterized membrane protein
MVDATNDSDLVGQLNKLVKMHADGVLSDDEFKALKAKLISETSATDKLKNQLLEDSGLAIAVYVLYFAGYATGITAIVGVIIAYVQAPSASPMLKSHYAFQIRTFWIGLIYLVVGLITSFIVVGVFVLLWWFVWSLIRNIKGILALNRNEPIANPGSWMFGDLKKVEK